MVVWSVEHLFVFFVAVRTLKKSSETKTLRLVGKRVKSEDLTQNNKEVTVI